MFLIRFLAFFCVGSFAVVATVSGEPVAPEATFETLQAGKLTFTHVRVKAVSARSLTIMHDGGLASVPLRDLSPELQARFHYDPTAEAAADASLVHARAVANEKRRVEAAAIKAKVKAPNESRFEKLLQNFGQPAELHEVDLRPQFFQLGLEVKDQGRRPSCAIFAVVSALEFQTATLIGQPEKLSEEYLLWATLKTIHKPSAPSAADAPERSDFEGDVGFSLTEVVTALRAYGIPTQARMPNRKVALGAIAEPPPEVIDEARNRRRVFIHVVPGRDQDTLVANLVHALNAGVPVSIGVRWPHDSTVRSGYLNAQIPLATASHAVTVVGYKNATGRMEDTVFIFKNSWGVSWGAGGYGQVTHAYLMKNLLHAVVLEVEPGTS